MGFYCIILRFCFMSTIHSGHSLPRLGYTSSLEYRPPSKVFQPWETSLHAEYPWIQNPLLFTVFNFEARNNYLKCWISRNTCIIDHDIASLTASAQKTLEVGIEYHYSLNSTVMEIFIVNSFE